MYKKTFITFCLLSSVLLSPALHAAPVLLHNLSFTLVTYDSDGQTPLFEKKVDIKSQSRNAYQVAWTSVLRTHVTDDPYPTHKIVPVEGKLALNANQLGGSFLHPHFWAKGAFNVQKTMSLWLDPSYLSKKPKWKVFDPGIFRSHDILLQSAPEDIQKKVLAMRRDYMAFRMAAHKEEAPRSLQKEFENFEEEFFRIKEQDEEKMNVRVKGEWKEVDVKVLGNDHYTLKVLNDELNPLVMSLSFHEEKAPRYLKDAFVTLKKTFSYQLQDLQQ
jgi:hypothetical protein